MNIDSVAVTILLLISDLFGVSKLPPNLEGWNITKSWITENGVYTFEAESKNIINECRNNPSASINFPTIIHAVQRIDLDNQLIEQFGDPTFNRARSFFGSPVVPCNNLLRGSTLRWTAISQSQYFSRILSFPKVLNYSSLQNILSEISNVTGAGSLLLFELLIILLFWGRIPEILALILMSSVFFLANYFIFSVPGFFGLPIGMLSAHRVADLSVWLGLGLLCFTLSYQHLLSWRLSKAIGWAVFFSSIVIVSAHTEDGIQLGTTIPMPFILPALALATYRSFKIFFNNNTNRRGLLESISLAVFVGTLFHDCFLVIGIIQGPALLSFGLNFGLSFFLVALNEYVISAFQERDQLKLQKMQLIKDANFASLARQISHDIRSPLAALNIVMRELSNESDEIRKISEIAIDRIQHIANGLLTEGQPESHKNPDVDATGKSISHEIFSIVFLPTIVEDIVAEKRVQLRSHSNLRIEISYSGSLEFMFLRIQPNEFKRIISNLLNNASEAITLSGSIKLAIEARPERIIFKITDNGCGIPKKILPVLMQKGKSFGKSAGHGLGLYHAKTTIESWEGSIQINSQESKGTTVVLNLTNVKAPHWFVPIITIKSSDVIVILDDDASIHEVWKARIRACAKGYTNFNETLHFFNEDELRKWFFSTKSKESTFLYLVDYEFKDTTNSGLEIIKKLSIASNSILVTSHFDEKDIQQECLNLGVRMIPKSIASSIELKMV